MRTSHTSRHWNSPSFIAPVFAAALVLGCLTLGAHAAAPPVPANAKVYNFDSDKPGEVPKGFTPWMTGTGGPVKWMTAIARDAPSGTQMLAQLSSEKIRKRYLHVTRDDITAADVDVSVKFRTIRGDMSATAGIVFRHSDRNNYYVVRASSNDKNVVAYKTVNGRRINIGVNGNTATYGVHARIQHRAWNTLRVTTKGNLFTVYLNDKKVLETEDDTFTAPGRVGVWTKSDAVSEFDDLTVAVLTP